MKIDKNEVLKIGNLARLKLSDKEIEEYTVQLNNILDYMDKLNEVNTEGVEPLTHPVEKVNVLREDENKSSIDRNVALKNAPAHNDEHFLVPRVIKGN